MNLTLKLRQRKTGCYAQLKCGPHVIKEVRMGDTVEGAQKKMQAANDSFYTAYQNLESLKNQLDQAGWQPKTKQELRAMREPAEKFEQLTIAV